MARNPKSPASAIPAAIRARPIVLVGLMGVGKSTIGRRLAQRLGLPFADADTEIERAAGMTISDIFARFGEAHFRDGERRSEEHTSELQSLMRISYAVFGLKKKNN